MIQDKEDIRISSLVTNQNHPDALFTLLGAPDDEGIRLNGGRPGAADGPRAIRESFFKMTPESGWPVHPIIYDAGDLVIEAKNLEQKQQLARKRAKDYFSQSQKFLISLGGGHDYGFPDTAGFLDVFKNPKVKPLVVNFDAHLDVRPTLKGPTSGTPFRQLVNDFNNQFELVEVGIQAQCNSSSHAEWALQNKVKIVSIDQIRNSNLLGSLKKALKSNRKRPAFLSLDIDCFCASLAPGCSASWPGGLRWEEALPAWQWLLDNFDVKGIGVYEVSPPLDFNNQTSRLAAKMIYETLRVKLHKKTALAVKSKSR